MKRRNIWLCCACVRVVEIPRSFFLCIYIDPLLNGQNRVGQRMIRNKGSSKKKCSKGILESFRLPGIKRTFAMEYQDKGLSLCKFSRYLVVIKIMDIRHKICHIYYKNADFESIFSQKDSLYCCYQCAKFSSTCKIIFIFSCILSSVLWDKFLWMTLYTMRSISNAVTVTKRKKIQCALPQMKLAVFGFCYQIMVLSNIISNSIGRLEKNTCFYETYLIARLIT